MRALTSEQIGLVRHVCLYGWVCDDVTLDREKLAAQIKHLTAERGCQVDNCPCLDFAYRGEVIGSEAFAEKLEADFALDRATDETQLVVVMDVKDSPGRSICLLLTELSVGSNSPVSRASTQ